MTLGVDVVAADVDGDGDGDAAAATTNVMSNSNAIKRDLRENARGGGGG